MHNDMMDDRENDWLAEEMRREGYTIPRRETQKFLSPAARLRQEHALSCDAEALRREHARNCDAEAVRRPYVRSGTPEKRPAARSLTGLIVWMVFLLIVVGVTASAALGAAAAFQSFSAILTFFIVLGVVLGLAVRKAGRRR